MVVYLDGVHPLHHRGICVDAVITFLHILNIISQRERKLDRWRVNLRVQTTRRQPVWYLCTPHRWPLFGKGWVRWAVRVKWGGEGGYNQGHERKNTFILEFLVLSEGPGPDGPHASCWWGQFCLQKSTLLVCDCVKSSEQSFHVWHFLDTIAPSSWYLWSTKKETYDLDLNALTSNVW